MYVIYKSQVQGVFHKYTTRVQGQRKFASDKPRARKSKVFISDKLPTLNCGHTSIFIEYTIVAMVHIQYYGGIILVRCSSVKNKICIATFSKHL